MKRPILNRKYTLPTNKHEYLQSSAPPPNAQTYEYPYLGIDRYVFFFKTQISYFLQQLTPQNSKR